MTRWRLPIDRRSFLRGAGATLALGASAVTLAPVDAADEREQWRLFESAFGSAAEAARLNVPRGDPAYVSPYYLAAALMATHDDRAVPLLWRLRDFAASYLVDAFVALGTDLGRQSFHQLMVWAEQHAPVNDDASCALLWGNEILACTRCATRPGRRVLSRAQATRAAADYLASGELGRGRWSVHWDDVRFHEALLEQTQDTFFLERHLAALIDRLAPPEPSLGRRLWLSGPNLAVRCLAAGYLLGGQQPGFDGPSTNGEDQWPSYSL